MIVVPQRSRVSRHHAVRSLSCSGPLATASRLQRMQRQYMLSAQTRSRMGNPCSFERICGCRGSAAAGSRILK